VGGDWKGLDGRNGRGMQTRIVHEEHEEARARKQISIAGATRLSAGDTTTQK